MKFLARPVIVLLLLSSITAPPSSAAAAPPEDRGKVPLVTLTELERLGRGRTAATARVALDGPAADKLKDLAFADPLESGQVPNYLKALARQTQAAPQFAQLLRTFLYGGTLPPETKMAVALRVAQQLKSPYTAAHAARWLRASERGRELLARMRSDSLARLAPADQLALSYADSLTHDPNGVSDSDFQKTRAVYNDSQLVELTMAVCLFNYFTRLNEALNLPVEPWALDEKAQTPASLPAYEPPPARVALISDDEMAATAAVSAAAKDAQKPASGLGLGVANSQRAMLRAPALALAWRSYGGAVREKFSIGRDIQLQVSFAVSTANGCRYCVLHQVLGLRRLGVSPTKLVAMKKDDSALTPRELAAVTFARKVTRQPASVTDEDYNRLKAEFGEQGAFEVMLQTCTFSFMNRLTDGLRLPSEDEAVRVYRETYGSDWK
ncbi:MAG TPA: carboxymuconolactone decarboxylase family protein [Pyrinomonadaceae bacterium]|nr:carboxymuconolactone decarboxylase family protein [Pyrinomonadaceae bacterium]